MKINELRDKVPEYKASFQNAWPYSHLVIDNFLDQELVEQTLADFPYPENMDIHGTNSSRLLGWQVNPLSSSYSFKPSLNQLFNYLKSTSLRKVFQDIAGISSDVLSDPDYHGSGLLLAPRGGVHRVHADRTYHPNPCYFPRLVLLIYFNKDWKSNYGGSLQLWNNKIDKCVTIAPLFNRCVLFKISSTSFHSIEDLTCPDNVYRRALNYYYLSDQAPSDSYLHETLFFPRPNERYSYWVNCLKNNFPNDFMSTIASRSVATRKMHGFLRSLIKRKNTNIASRLCSNEDLQRWDDFNSTS
jgi:Rps23 Pro-64 3,4-dihydroxylase Tpa1-like proline 4-hydroxylase